MRFLLSQRSPSRILRARGPHCPSSPIPYSNLLSRPTLYRRGSTITYAPNKSDYEHVEYIGQTGCTYTIDEVVRREDYPFRRILFASSDDGERFLLKYIQPENFKNHLDVNYRLRDLASHVRLVKDVIPNMFMVVYGLGNHRSLQIVQNIDLPLILIKKILKSVLSILAELHDRDILHGGMMANAILINWTKDEGKIDIDKVQLAILEDTAYIRPGSDIVGRLVGPRQWRSPEAYAMGPVNKPSDIFSFAILCLYAVQKRPIFGDTPIVESLIEGSSIEGMSIEDLQIEDRGNISTSISVIERQMSYFADKDGLRGFLNYLGRDHPFVPIIELAREGFNVDRPRQPFSRWEGVDEDFRDLILAMTNFDPSKRITARQALGHKWFEGVEVVQQDNHSEIQEIQESNQGSVSLASEI
ncbi:kinase-like domain-containing protein, partial [Aspergillus granulosus]